jgi:hypothetical protein
MDPAQYTIVGTYKILNSDSRNFCDQGLESVCILYGQSSATTTVEEVLDKLYFIISIKLKYNDHGQN